MGRIYYASIGKTYEQRLISASIIFFISSCGGVFLRFHIKPGACSVPYARNAMIANSCKSRFMTTFQGDNCNPSLHNEIKRKYMCENTSPAIAVQICNVRPKPPT